MGDEKSPLEELIPIGNSAAKVNSWRNRCAEICYATASKKPENVRRTEEAQTAELS